MKELSIEEKAKRYESALKRCRKLYNEAKANEYNSDIEDYETIFPELAERDDDRIRKELITHCKNTRCVTEEGAEKIAKWIAWLEKQKVTDEEIIFRPVVGTDIRIAAKQALEKIDIGKKVVLAFNGAYIPVNGKTVGEINSEYDAWLEKQRSEPNWCHHKVDLSNYSEEYRKAYYDGWNNCNQQHSQCKSEWNDVIKCLINGMKFYYEDNEEATWGTEKFSMKVKDILSWLEKQNNKTMDCCQNHQDSSRPNGCIVLEDFNEGEGFYKLHLNYLSKKQIEEVEEMVRMWNHEKSNAPNENIKTCIGMCLTDVDEQRFTDYNTSLKECLAWLEKQGEQKPADEVKPKFKVGDWISGYYTSYQVLSVNNDGYVVEDVDGNKINILFENEKFHHFWTIKDAKDGDVLYAKGSYFKEYIFSFSSFTEDNVISTHFGYDVLRGTFDTKFSRFGREEDFVSVTPATEEQRDLLFQKMYEAGYEWDAETKELKRIEQNSTWSEEDNKWFESLIQTFEDGYLEGFNQLKSYGVISWLKFIKERVQSQSKVEWSEEDEKIVLSIEQVMNCASLLNIVPEKVDKIRTWLKSLKERL